MTKYQQIGIRIAIATGVGVLVAAIAVAVAWRNTGRMRQVWPEQWATREAIDIIDDLIRFRKTPPQSIEGLSGPDNLRKDEKGRPIDGWGRPLLYSTDGDKYVITSLGRDGKPGGVGLDCDTSNLNDWPQEAVPTFSQFLASPMTRGSISACLACGLLAFVVSFVTVDPSALRGWAIIPLILKLAFTILGALFVASIMSMLEIPTH